MTLVRQCGVVIYVFAKTNKTGITLLMNLKQLENNKNASMDV